MAARHRKHGKKMAGQERLARVDCGECGRPAGLVTGVVVYPHRPDLHDRPYWRCCACGAYVGCHQGTYQPLGTPCGPETRLARSKAHEAFDPLWRAKVSAGTPKHEARPAGYRWLSEQLGIPFEKTHIGMMDAATALRVVELCAPYRRAEA